MGAKKKKRRHFTPEYKSEVVRLVCTGGKTAGQAARDLDLTETSVRAWVRQAEIAWVTDITYVWTAEG